jgi:WD40 repeat protein
MKALLPNVLETALEIQDVLLGPTQNFAPRRDPNDLPQEDPDAELTPEMRDHFHAVNGLSNASWFFYSPLQYWSCSAQNIADDHDIIATVNEGSRLATSVNVTLRHSIVFSGKRFEDHRLVAADALVVTLIYKLDSPVGRHWEKKAQEIARQKSLKWRLYPPDGRAIGSTLYEFRFQPLTFHEDLFLGIAYSLTALYFALSLSKVRALKSRFGLIVAVVTQIAVSIMSSFTICAILKIDLSKIPRETYPLVILAVGLENILRLISAVIMTPSGASTASRMSEALGKTGHIALAGVAQNLAILWMLTKVVNPSVAAFCTFVAIALAFDFFYLLTFFVAVLSVDVRRTDLQESLSRPSSCDRRSSSPESGPSHNTWVGRILRGDPLISTRVAGTAVMVGFIIAAQRHFFDNETIIQTALRFSRQFTSEPRRPRQTPISFLSVDINQARTPTAWLQMQDHETAHEVIKVVKPNAHSYIANVYGPLVFVLDGSDRTPNHMGLRRFLPAFYDFTRHQTVPFIITVILLVAAVYSLMRYLLWDESLEEGDDDRPEDEPLLSVKSLSGHALDIVLLSASSEGIIASIGLDRWIRIWDIRRGGNYLLRDPESILDPFPVLAMAIDSDSNWLAILSAKDMVALWNIPEKRWGPTMAVVVKGRTPAAFFFSVSSSELINPVILVRHNGLMTELHVESNENTEFRICRTPLVCVRAHIERALPSGAVVRVISLCKSGCVRIALKTGSGWTSEEVPCGSKRDSEVLSVLSLPVLNAFLAIRTHTLELIDIRTHRVTHIFETKPMKPNTFQCFHSPRRGPQCGSVGLGSFALAYTSAECDECIMQVYIPKREGDTICFRDPLTPGSKTCCLWTETVEQSYSIQHPGDWQALPEGHIIGIRKCFPTPGTVEPGSHHTAVGSGLRRRGSLVRQPPQSFPKQEKDDWEVWSLSGRGERTTLRLYQNTGMGNDHLLFGGLGPLERVGKRNLAVGLGNVVKVITVGHDRFHSVDSGSDNGTFVGITSNRRKRLTVWRKRTY